jgi:hypothetical protein
MVKEECKKLLTKNVVLLLLLLCILNIVVVFYKENKGTPYSGEGGYKDQWKQIAIALEKEDITRVYEKKYEDFQKIMLSQTGIGQSYSTKQWYVQKRILNELEGIIGYEDYLNSMNQVKQAAQISLFQNSEDYFSTENQRRTIKAYEKMKTVTIEPGPSLGIELFLKCEITDIIALFALIFIQITIWTKDKEIGMQRLINTCYKGRGHLAIAKIKVTCITVFVMEIFLFGGNLLIGSHLYGLGNLSRFLPSVLVYQQTTWKINLWQLIIFFMLYKFVAYIVCSLVIGIVAQLVQNAISVVILAVTIFGISFIVYQSFSSGSGIGQIKYLLPYGLIRTENIFIIYRNLNFFGYPVEFVAASTAVLGVGIILLFFAQIRLSIQNKSILWKHPVLKNQRVDAFMSKISNKLDQVSGLFCFELRKIFVHQKILGLLCILMIFQGVLLLDKEVQYYDYTEYCYREYMIYLEGELTPKKERYLQEEEARFADLLQSQMEYSLEGKTNTQIEQQLKAYEAFGMVKEYIEYLKINQIQYITYESAFQDLIADKSNMKDAELAFEIMLFLVLCSSQIYGIEYQLGVDKFCGITLYGKRRLEFMKIGIGMFINVMILSLLYIPFLAKVIITNDIPLDTFSYPAASIRSLNGYGNQLTIGTYLIVVMLIRFLYMNMVSFFIYLLSEKMRSVINTIMIGLFVFAIPFIILAFNDSLTFMMLPYSPMLGNYLLTFSPVMIIGFILIQIVVIFKFISDKLREK